MVPAVYISLFALVLLYVGFCALIYWRQESMIFVPLGSLKRTEKVVLASPTKEVYLRSGKSCLLHGLYIYARKQARKGLILYFHGNTGNIKRWSLIAEEFTSYGYDVLVPDYRGYGKSTGLRTEEDLHRDADLWMQEALKNYSESEIILYGRSLGSGFAVRLAANSNPRRLILETPYHSMAQVAAKRYFLMPIRLMLKFPLRSDLYIKHVNCPVAIFHGTKDKIVPYSSALKLYKLIEGDPRHEMITIPGGGHSNLNSFPLFREKMHELLLPAHKLTVHRSQSAG